MTQNIACRVFKEQIKLINQLPEKERATVLYLAINNSFNQIDNQNDNQIDNQNENAYVSESLSDISKCVLELLKKNIVCKEFSNNYGGKRNGSGRKGNGKLGGLAKASKCQQKLANDGKSSNKIKENKIKENNIKPSLQDVIDYCNERNSGVDANKWYDYYTANGWKVGRNPMKDWKATVRTWERKQEKPAHPTNEGSEKTVLIDTTSFYLDDTMDEYKDLFEGVLNKDELALNVWNWIVKNFEGRRVKISFIRSMIEKFKKGGI